MVFTARHEHSRPTLQFLASPHLSTLRGPWCLEAFLGFGDKSFCFLMASPLCSLDLS